MLSDTAPIGVMDAGLGGLTVVSQLQALLPHEQLLYFGDGKYQPYGNRSREEILSFTRQMLDFFEKRKVKAAAIACNTISTLLEEYAKDYPFRIYGIVKSGSEDVAALHPKKAVLLSTMFTAKSGCYEHYIHEKSPETEIIAQGCPKLARLIEDGNFDMEKIEAELKETLGHAAAQHPDANLLILGCTHFPLIRDVIGRMYPQFTQMIDPAETQARQIKEYLTEKNALSQSGEGGLSIYTTSDPEVYRRMAAHMGLSPPISVELAEPLCLLKI